MNDLREEAALRLHLALGPIEPPFLNSKNLVNWLSQLVKNDKANAWIRNDVLGTLTKLIEEDPENSRARLTLAFLYTSLELFEWAIAEFQETCNVPDLALHSRRMLANCLSSLGEFEAAVDQFERSLAETTEHPSDYDYVYYDLGYHLVRYQRFEDAREVFQKLCLGSPRYADFLAWIDSCERARGDDDGGGALVRLPPTPHPPSLGHAMEKPTEGS